MHGWVDSEISAVLLALIVIVVVSLAFAHQVTSRSSRRLKKSQRIAGDVGVIVQREEQFEADRKSMLGTSNCVVCQKSATPHRCSKCKSAKYWYWGFSSFSSKLVSLVNSSFVKVLSW